MESATHAIVLCAAIALATSLAGCGPGGSSGSANANANAEPLADPSQSPCADVDWTVIDPAPPTETQEALRKLLRCVDLWHRGGRQVVLVQVHPDGTVMDEYGNATRLSLREWRGIAYRIRATDEGLRARSKPDELFDTNVPAHEYTLRMDTDDQLYLTCEGRSGW